MLHAHPEAPDSFCFEPAEFPQPSYSMASARNPPPPGPSPKFHRAVLLPGLLMKLTQGRRSRCSSRVRALGARLRQA